jgi:hypothetical protein
MAYRITYGGRDLFDPYTDDVVTDAKLTAKSNNPDYLDFTVPLGHDLYGEVEGRGEVVELSWDGTVLFRGEVESIDVDAEGNKEVACTGALGWLGDTVVRPYSTVVNEQPLCAPSNVDGLFQWYVDQHDEHTMDDRRRFVVGVNQGAALDPNNYVYRSSEQLPTTWDEISDKILDSLGGYVTVDYTEPTTVNLYADIHETNAQVIDFGVNITDFSSKTDTGDMYTAVRAVGKAPEKDEGDESEDEKPAPTLADLPDQCVEGTIWKRGDVVYDAAQVERYGYREYAYSDNDCTTAAGLLTSAVKKLKALMSPTLTVTVKAVDLALYMEGYDHLKVGQAVRVRSALHGVDEYLMVSSVTVDLQDPGSTEYTLGAEHYTLTGQQSSYLKSQTASINKALDTAAALSPEVKAAAKTATDAASAAATAAEKADAAAESVDGKLDKVEAADTYATITDLKVTDGKADSAQSAADTANTAATDAKQAATDAAATATDAKTAADAAATDAATAKTDASAAKSTATTANTTAKAAQTTATTANATAKAASATATTAKETADAAQTTADAAQTTADTAKAATDTLQTLIRETSDGIEVGKSSDGSTYTGTHTLVGTDAFSVHDEEHKVLASFGATSASIGNAAELASLQVGKLLSIESYNSESYIITGSSGYSDLHIGAIASVDNFAGPQVALLKDANAVAAHADYYYFYGGTTSLYPATFTWAQFRKKLLTHTYVGAVTRTMIAVDSTHSTCVLFTAAQYKAITGVAFDQKKHNVTCMNGEHDACTNIWSMTASYSASDGKVHLMCMTSQKVSSAIRVNYTITIDAS